MNDIPSLVETLTRYNEAYRAGNPLVDDRIYDGLVEQLRALDPDHPFLKQVEPETFAGKREVSHPEPMLSTEKAYNTGQLSRFVDRVEKAAAEQIRAALAKVRQAEISVGTEFTVADMVEAGLTGGAVAAEKRAFVGSELGLGWANAKTFLHRLNTYGVRRAEFDTALEKWEAVHD